MAIQCKDCKAFVTEPDFQGYTKHHVTGCPELAVQERVCPKHKDHPNYIQSAYGCHPTPLKDGKMLPACSFDARVS